MIRAIVPLVNYEYLICSIAPVATESSPTRTHTATEEPP